MGATLAPAFDTKAGLTEVAFAAEACNLFRAASVAGGMPRFPQGWWQRACRRQAWYFSKPTSFFCRS